MYVCEILQMLAVPIGINMTMNHSETIIGEGALGVGGGGGGRWPLGRGLLGGGGGV